MTVRTLSLAPGTHQTEVTRDPDLDRKLAVLAAEVVRDLLEDPKAYTSQRGKAHAGEIVRLFSVSCSCGQACGVADSYGRGLAEGYLVGSVAAMSYGFADKIRAQRDSAPLLPPDLKISLTVPEITVRIPDGVGLLVKPSSGTVVEYGEDGKISGTRPR